MSIRWLGINAAVVVALSYSVAMAQQGGAGGNAKVGGGSNVGADANAGGVGAGANVGGSAQTQPGGPPAPPTPAGGTNANVGGNASNQPSGFPESPGINVQGPRGGSVPVQPGAPNGTDVNVQGPRGANINVQPGAGGVNADVRNVPGEDRRGEFDRREGNREREMAGRDTDRWRFRWDGGRWWYYGPGNRWSYYDNGNWTDYAPDYGGADSNFRYYNGNWWYWTNNGWLVYQNGQWSTPSSPGVAAYTDYDNQYYYGGSPNYRGNGYYGYYGGMPYRYWSGYAPGAVGRTGEAIGRTGAAIGRGISGRR